MLLMHNCWTHDIHKLLIIFLADGGIGMIQAPLICFPYFCPNTYSFSIAATNIIQIEAMACNFSTQQVCWRRKPMKYSLETMSLIPEFLWSSNLLVCQCHWQLIKYWLEGLRWTLFFSLGEREIGLNSLWENSYPLQWDGDSQKICQNYPCVSLKVVLIIWPWPLLSMQWAIALVSGLTTH